MAVPFNVLLRSRHQILAATATNVPESDLRLFRTETPRRRRSLEGDATLSEQHRVRNRVSTYPIEEGSNLADHVVRDPIRLKLRIAVTSTPLPAAVGNQRQLSAGEAPNDQLPADGWGTILAFADDASLLNVTTLLGTYEHMVIDEAKTVLDRLTGRNAIYEVSLMEVRLPDRVVGLSVTAGGGKITNTSGPGRGRESTEGRGNVLTETVPLNEMLASLNFDPPPGTDDDEEEEDGDSDSGGSSGGSSGGIIGAQARAARERRETRRSFLGKVLGFVNPFD